MDKIEGSPPANVRSTSGDWVDSELVVDEPEFKPLSAEDVSAWRKSQVKLSLWQVIGWQWLAVLVAGVVAWLLTGVQSVGLSAAYGGVAIALPSTVVVWGMTAGRLARLLSMYAQGSLAALMFWEGIKVLLTIALLALAAVVVTDLNWLALVAGLVFVLKVYWLAFLVQSRAAR